MAKGQVSEEELSKGLRGIGNFGGLSQPRVRRDNPFGDSRAETTPADPVKSIEVRPSVPEERVAKSAEAAVPKIEPKVVVRTVAGGPKPVLKQRQEKGTKWSGSLVNYSEQKSQRKNGSPGTP
jgi:hypothetical protein